MHGPILPGESAALIRSVPSPAPYSLTLPFPPMARNLSPELLRRIDAIEGCQGRWLVDCRELEGNYSYALRSLSEPWPYWQTDELTGKAERYWHCTADGSERNPYKLGTLQDAARYCAHTGWQARLLFVADRLNDDCSWPGGYNAPSIYRSNARVFRDQFSKELAAGADGDADGVALDVRYLTDDMLETLQALENYPLISEDDHSELELELQDEAWDSWAASDWRRAVEKAIDAVLPEDATLDGDEILDGIENIAQKLLELFHSCCEWTNTCWFEDGTDQWIDLDRVADALDLHTIRDFTGLQLLSPDQTWRTEPYPWPGAEPSPLLPVETI